MSENIIDILEEEIYRLDPEVMERLLWDHSRTPDESLKNELNVDGHHHIYWATDNYETHGEGFQFFDEIQIISVTGKNSTLVRPRAAKSKEEQEKRTRDKAEVFTPSWVCNAQNNLVDDAWFGRKGVFNIEVTLDTGRHVWATTKQPIEFPEGKTWKDYIWDKRLEVACGEAPYLVSRYDTTTGEPISIKHRIGLFDRKMRVIGENVDNTKDWWLAVEWAVKSTYGFEWQGDNLLLAREALLVSINEYYLDFCKEHNIDEKLSEEEIKHKSRFFAYLISWNIFQMDGIKMVLPMTCHDEEESSALPTLFEIETETPKKKVPCPGCAKKDVHKHNGIPAIVVEWAREHGATKNERVAFRDLLPKKH